MIKSIAFIFITITCFVTAGMSYTFSLISACQDYYAFEITSARPGASGIILSSQAVTIHTGCFGGGDFFFRSVDLHGRGLLVSQVEVELIPYAEDNDNWEFTFTNEINETGLDLSASGGWVNSIAVGWVYAEEFPWIWLPSRGWHYVVDGEVHYYSDEQVLDFSEEDQISIILYRPRAKPAAIPTASRGFEYLASNSYYFWNPEGGWFWKGEFTANAFSYQANDWIEW